MKSKIATYLTLMLPILICANYAGAEVDVEDILQEAEREVRHFDKQQLVAQMWVLVEIAQLYSEAGNQEQARETLQIYLDLSTSSEYEAQFDEQVREWANVQLAPIQVQIGDLSGAMKTVDAIKSLDRKNFALLSIIECLAEMGLMDKALLISSQIPWQEILYKSQVLETIAEAQAEAGDFAAARETLQSIDELQADNNDDRQRILGVKRRSVQFIAAEQVNRGNFVNALETVSLIDDRFRVRTLCEIAKLQAAQNNTSAAKHTLETAERLTEETKTDVYFSRIAETQVEIGDVDGATRTISKHLNGVEAGHAMLQVSVGYAKAGRQEQAKTAFEKGMALIRTDTNKVTDALLENIAVMQVQLEEIEGAIKTVHEIQNAQTKAYAFRLIVSELLKKSDNGNAVSIADSIDDKYHRAIAYREIASAQAVMDKDNAMKSFHKSLQVAQSIPIGGSTDVITLYELGQAQRQAGFHDDASETFAHARTKAMNYDNVEYIAQLFQSISREQTVSGDLKGALSSARAETDSLRKVRSLLGVAEGILNHHERCKNND